MINMKFEGNYLENDINFDPIKILDKLIKETKSIDLVIHFLRVHVSEEKKSARALAFLHPIQCMDLTQ